MNARGDHAVEEVQVQVSCCDVRFYWITNSNLEDLSTKNFLYIHFMLSLQESRSTIEISAHVTFPSVERLGMKSYVSRFACGTFEALLALA